MQDRIPLHPGRIKLTQVSGNIYDMERADEPQQVGTPLNKSNLFNSANETRYGATTPNEAFNYLAREWHIVVPASGWVEGDSFSTNQVTVSGMKAVYNPIYASDPADVLSVETEAQNFGMIAEMETFNGYVIFKAIDKPESDVRVIIKGV